LTYFSDLGTGTHKHTYIITHKHTYIITHQHTYIIATFDVYCFCCSVHFTAPATELCRCIIIQNFLRTHILATPCLRSQGYISQTSCGAVVVPTLYQVKVHVADYYKTAVLSNRGLELFTQYVPGGSLSDAETSSFGDLYRYFLRKLFQQHEYNRE